MIKNSFLTLACAIAAMNLTACGSDNKSNNTVKNQTPDIKTPDNSKQSELAKAFAKSTSVFGIPIYGTVATPDEAMLHAANVMAQYLDNDEDGVPDNQMVVDHMVAEGAALIMAKDESDLEPLFDKIPESDALQDLYAEEVIPDGADEGEFDATLEEVLHLITHVGYAGVYPAVFGEAAGSAIADAMDMARGGQFEAIPASYPAGAWYTYDDASCDYSCMVTEYTYWALTSILGAQDFTERLGQISQEWQLNTSAKVQNLDAAVYAILTDSQYALATQLPNGDYSADEFEISGSQSPVDDTAEAGPEHELLQAAAAGNSGYKIAFTDDTHVYMMNADGSEREVLADGTPIVGYIAWGANAEYVYFASAKGPEESAWEAFRVDVETKELQQLSLFGEDVRSLSLSPDGQYMALSIMSGNSNIGDNNDNLTQFNTDLYIVDMQKAQAIWDAGEKLTKADMSVLVSSPAAEQFWYEELNWNPVMPEDGGEPVLAYSKTWRYDEDDVSYTHVYSIRADGTEQQLIIENKDMPLWDFSGETLCFLDLSCYSLTEDASIQLNVSDIALEVASATVSPDGEFILFEVGDEDRKAGMARLSEEAENPGVVIAGGNAYEPRWSPKPVQ